MLRRNQKPFAVKKTLSNSMSQAPTAPDNNASVEFSSKRYLFDSQQQLNLSKICFSNRKISAQKRSQTSRKVINHIETVEDIHKRLQKINQEDNPFLRAKLKHIVKKWPTTQYEQSLLGHIRHTQSWMQQPKYVTLRRITKDNSRKQIELKNFSIDAIKLH